jgi:hypothetical protein
MTLRPALVALASALLLSATACAPFGVSTEAQETQGQRDPEEWAKQQFSEERWGTPGAYSAAGGLDGHGSEAGLEFTPEKAGWYAVGMACEGASSITVTVAAADGVLGDGSTDCASAVTTTMELPAGKITMTVEGAEAKGMWALAVAPTDAP